MRRGLSINISPFSIFAGIYSRTPSIPPSLPLHGRLAYKESSTTEFANDVGGGSGGADALLRGGGGEQ